MYQRIEVPLDGSEPAARTLVHAAELARFSGAPLHLVRIVDRVRIPVLLVPVDGGEAIAVGA